MSAFGELAAFRVDNFYFDVGDGHASGDEIKGRRAVVDRNGAALRFEGVTFDVRDFAAGAYARSRDAEGSLGEAVNGKQRRGVETVLGEAVGEAPESFRPNGLSAIESSAPRT